MQVGDVFKISAPWPWRGAREIEITEGPPESMAFLGICHSTGEKFIYHESRSCWYPYTDFRVATEERLKRLT